MASTILLSGCSRKERWEAIEGEVKISRGSNCEVKMFEKEYYAVNASSSTIGLKDIEADLKADSVEFFNAACRIAEPGELLCYDVHLKITESEIRDKSLKTRDKKVLINFAAKKRKEELCGD